MDCLVNVFAIFASIATIVTAFIAGIALFDWKKQIHYNLIMEAKANSRIAIDIIETLRKPFRDGEVDNQLRIKFMRLNNGVNPIEDQYLTFRTRLTDQANYYNPILLIREKVWASLGHDHLITRFYDEIIATIQKIEQAHLRRIKLYKDGESNGEESNALYRVVVSYEENDELSNRLQSLLSGLRDIK